MIHYIVKINISHRNWINTLLWFLLYFSQHTESKYVFINSLKTNAENSIKLLIFVFTRFCKKLSSIINMLLITDNCDSTCVFQLFNVLFFHFGSHQVLATCKYYLLNHFIELKLNVWDLYQFKTQYFEVFNLTWIIPIAFWYILICLI